VAEDADREDESLESEESPPESEPPPSAPFVPPSPDEVKRRAELLATPEVQAAIEKATTACKRQERQDLKHQAWADSLSADHFPETVKEAAEEATRKVDAAKKRFYRQQKKMWLDTERVLRSGKPLTPDPVPDHLLEAGEVAEGIAANDATAARTLNVLKTQHLEGEELHVATAQWGTTPEAHKKAKQRLTARVRAIIGYAIALLFLPFLWRQHVNVVRMQAEVDALREEMLALHAPTPHDESAPIVARGLTACAGSDWARCEAELDRAAATSMSRSSASPRHLNPKPTARSSPTAGQRSVADSTRPSSSSALPSASQAAHHRALSPRGSSAPTPLPGYARRASTRRAPRRPP
jgi:hypothetical protein